MLQRLKALWQLSAPAAPASVRSAVPRVQNRSSAYESGSRVARTADWDVPDASANLATASASTIRARCRDAVRNDSWARSIVETFVDDVIGWGVKPLCRATDEALRQQIQRRFEDWSAVADADGVLDFAGLQALAVRNLVVDGETFIRVRRRKAEDGLPVPLQLQVLGAEMCDESYTRPSTNGTVIRDGIEVNGIGQRTAYYLRECAPGEDDGVRSSSRVHRVPADQVLHLFEPLRPGQRRGVSMLAAALVRLHELDKYSDATLLRLQLSSMFTAILKATPRGDVIVNPLTGEELTEPASTEDPPTLRLAPGTLQQLDPGEDLSFNKPPDPPVGFDAFVKHELRAAGAAAGVLYRSVQQRLGRDKRPARASGPEPVPPPCASAAVDARRPPVPPAHVGYLAGPGRAARGLADAGRHRRAPRDVGAACACVRSPSAGRRELQRRDPFGPHVARGGRGRNGRRRRSDRCADRGR